jgi:hypothetical protein
MGSGCGAAWSKIGRIKDNLKATRAEPQAAMKIAAFVLRRQIP